LDYADQFPEAIEDLHGRIAKRGRAPEAFTVGSEIQIYLADSMEQARAEAEPTMLAFEEGHASTTGPHQSDDERGDTISAIWASSLVGSPDEVSAQIQDYLDAGGTTFEMKFIYQSIDHLIEQWTRFQEEVAPNFA
jgi:alkanesulfonate monooxygenase SsuD/methylene tetrahydromethanopterin reductase-like flavin-dependent oxidoreductase (luciferase family)